ncbi:MAG: hypothetical protein L3J47_08905 [Sulfurovum sp.]|nr:hypothetical protein [Sulfurovum sp.]
MIIYIHGFGGSGKGNKAELFRDYFKSIGEPFVAPSLSYVPKLAIETLQELIISYGEVYLIGSSLGGYYATYLAQMPEVQKVVLINPATQPYETLKRALGDAPNFYDDSTFVWQESHLEMLKELEVDALTVWLISSKFSLYLQKGDEILDYQDALDKYELKEQNLVVEEGGSHSFEGIEGHFEKMRAFFAVGEHFKHTPMIRGVGLELEEIASRVGDLYYDDMARFLEALVEKLQEDANADNDRGRTKLSAHLRESAGYIQKSVEQIKAAWEVCKYPTIRWMIDNGFNKYFDFTQGEYPKDILSWYYGYAFTMPEELLHHIRRYYMEKFHEANSIDAPMSGIGTWADLGRFNMGVAYELTEKYPEYEEEIEAIVFGHFQK